MSARYPTRWRHWRAVAKAPQPGEFRGLLHLLAKRWFVSYFAADAFWDKLFGFLLWQASGHDEIRELVKDYVNRMTHGDIKIVNLAVAGKRGSD